MMNPLQRYRDERKLTTETIAKLIGYSSVDGVYRLFRYENGPSFEVAERIGALLGQTGGEVLEHYAKEVRKRRAS